MGSACERLYGAETWTVYKGTEVQPFLVQLSPQNTEDEMVRGLWTQVLERTGLPSTFALLGRPTLRWSGHLVKVDDERLPK